MTQYEKMTETNVKKLITLLAIPTVISMLVTAVYNVADTFFVSRINDSASAAISVVFSLMTLIQSIGFTIGMGSGSLISVSLGNRKEKDASKYASQGILMGLILGVIFITFGLIFNSNIMSLLGASETSLPYSILYGRWIFIASPFMILSFIMNNILRNEGKARLSMIGLSFGGLLNIALDPLFIYGFDMGISGAGLATMISQITSFMILASFFLFNRTVCKINVKYLTKDIRSYLEALRRGMPTLFRQGFATGSNIILNFLAKPYGDSIVAALGITAKLYMILRNIIVGIGQGYMPVVGYNYGAKKYSRIKESFYYVLILETIICALFTIAFFIFSNELVNIFTDSNDVIVVGGRAVKYLSFSLIFLGLSTTINQSLQIIGYAKSATFLASLRQGLVYIPLIFMLEALFSETGLCLTQPISDTLTALISIPFIFYFFKIISEPKEETKIDYEAEE